MAKLVDYLPDYYDGVLEIDELMTAEQALFDRRSDTLSRLLLNQFVVQADADGLSLFETQLGIEVAPDESLETRRTNVLLRILPPQPITIGYFRQLIASLKIPTEIVVDSVNCTIKTLSDAQVITAEQIVRLRFLLNTYLPSNLAYQISKQDDNLSELPVNVGVATHSVVSVRVGVQAVDYEEV